MHNSHFPTVQKIILFNCKGTHEQSLQYFKYQPVSLHISVIFTKRESNHIWIGSLSNSKNLSNLSNLRLS